MRLNLARSLLVSWEKHRTSIVVGIVVSLIWALLAGVVVLCWKALPWEIVRANAAVVSCSSATLVLPLAEEEKATSDLWLLISVRAEGGSVDLASGCSPPKLVAAESTPGISGSILEAVRQATVLNVEVDNPLLGGDHRTATVRLHLGCGRLLEETRKVGAELAAIEGPFCRVTVRLYYRERQRERWTDITVPIVVSTMSTQDEVSAQTVQVRADPVCWPSGSVMGFAWSSDGRLADDTLYRTRIDDEPWSVWSSAERREFAGLGPGTHSFYVEAGGTSGEPVAADQRFSVVEPCARASLLPVTFSGGVSVFRGVTGTTVRMGCLFGSDWEIRLDYSRYPSIFPASWSPVPGVIWNLTAIWHSQLVSDLGVVAGGGAGIYSLPGDKVLLGTVSGVAGGYWRTSWITVRGELSAQGGYCEKLFGQISVGLFLEFPQWTVRNL